ncbi:hypothetical protein RFY44_06005 [Acinetobacter bereziniae]|uniref:hypothetical protein n=1 Tax=Acinetobacter bereziniae TaxID=106648 RepID=UPI0012500C59|nr:hypothetical protein [Acinetobacter bereziniae]MDQ9818434.1 hypothetical protein [Acinetobacter bereziniae]
MSGGVLLQDEQGRVSFDGTQRIPKVLVEVTINIGEVTKSVSLPRVIRGNLYYYFKPLAVQDTEPYYDPVSYNYRVTVTGTTAKVDYIPYASWTTAPKAFKVFIGEF